jgi:hypothetical protein
MPDTINLDDLVKEYRNGVSENALARKFGVQRRVIRRYLLDAGITPRDRSAAMVVRMAKASPADRKGLTLPANIARRSRAPSSLELERKARWRQSALQREGAGELDLIKMLGKRRCATSHQYAIGPYNIDILAGSVAVEVHSQTAYPHNRRSTRKRIEYLFDRGFNVLYVLCAQHVTDEKKTVKVSIPAAAAADYIATFAEFTKGDPSFRRQYRMIRRTGELVASASGDLDNITLV